MKTFYVCSFGGSGSTLLANSLKPYGRVEHIHSRIPPLELEYIGNNKGGDTYYEWFNVTVIFIKMKKMPLSNDLKPNEYVIKNFLK